jgi:uncharacterized membrane protein
MLIKDVYQRIEELERDRRDFMKIQNYCLGIINDMAVDSGKPDILSKFEDILNLGSPLRNLASRTINNIDNEIIRLKNIIENTTVNIGYRNSMIRKED